MACLGRRAALASPPAPYSAIEIDETSRGAPTGPGGGYVLALDLRSGWFVGDLATFTPGGRFAVPVLQTRRLAGGAAPPAPAVVVVAEGASVDGSGPSRILAVAAAGASGIPSLCRVPLRGALESTSMTHWTLDPSGELSLGGGDAGFSDPASGRHWLVFP